MEAESNQIPTSHPNSGTGIASFVIGVVSIIALFILIGYAGYMEVTTPGGIDEESSEAVLIGLLMIAFALAVIVGIVLGIIGVMQTARKRLYSILGLVINLASILFVAGVFYLGSAA